MKKMNSNAAKPISEAVSMAATVVQRQEVSLLASRSLSLFNITSTCVQ
jgi:hypothetical protein